MVSFIYAHTRLTFAYQPRVRNWILHSKEKVAHPIQEADHHYRCQGQHQHSHWRRCSGQDRGYPHSSTMPFGYIPQGFLFWRIHLDRVDGSEIRLGWHGNDDGVLLAFQSWYNRSVQCIESSLRVPIYTSTIYDKEIKTKHISNKSKMDDFRYTTDLPISSLMMPCTVHILAFLCVMFILLQGDLRFP